MELQLYKKQIKMYLIFVLGVCWILGIAAVFTQGNSRNILYQILQKGFTALPVFSVILTRRITKDKTRWRFSVKVWKDWRLWSFCAFVPGILIVIGATVYFMLFPEQYSGKLILLSKLFACSMDFLLNSNEYEEDIQPSPSVEECYRFIRECGYFFLATSMNNYPKLRPFGMIYSNGHGLFFTTDKRKNVYSELVGNPQVEIAAYNLHTHKWVRISGRAEPESSIHIREGILFVYPVLKQKYQDDAEMHLAIFKLIVDEIRII